MNTAWIILVFAGFFEVGFTFCLGKAKGLPFSEAWPWYLGFLISLVLSMLLLMRASRELPLGTAYAVWTGIGAFGTSLMGILVFQEPAHFWRLFFLFTLIASVIGLKAFSEG
ncbi:MAG: multidrug efflux SMR transporter [Bacteroidia bacterium]|nr:multidrug efflux SMR transporter [Bacteroidia bacterium]